MKNDLWTSTMFAEKTNSKKKRKTLSASDRYYIWDHQRLYGRTCHICGQRITKISDLELDHRRAFAKGGSKLYLAHRDCNRKKGSKSLSEVQKRLGLKKTTARKKHKHTKTKRSKPEMFGDIRIPEIKF